MINYNLYARSRLLTFFLLICSSHYYRRPNWDQSSQMLSFNTPRSAPVPAGRYNRNVNWTKYYSTWIKKCSNKTGDQHQATLKQSQFICNPMLPLSVSHWLRLWLLFIPHLAAASVLCCGRSEVSVESWRSPSEDVTSQQPSYREGWDYELLI